jgi:ACS family hexuronate transporter-like MFS transporter
MPVPIEAASSALSGPSTAGGRYRWIICALLFVATTILYVDRQILSLLKGTLDQEFHWTNEQFGDVTAAFQASYGIGLLGYGWFVDRWGVKIGYALTMAGWSLAAMGHSLVFSVRGFIVARGALGLAESGNFPSAIKAVALWFPKKERALATAIFNSGANVGPVLAPATIPFMAAAAGWRSTFIIVGAMGILWQAGWWFFYETPQRQRRLGARELAYIQSDADDPTGGGRVSWPRLLNHRQTWAFVFAKLLTDPVWWFFLFWLPDYFKKSRGLDIQQSWVYLVSIYGIVTILSVFGGWVTGMLVRSGWTVTRARKTGLFFFALCVTPICLATRASLWGAVALIGLAASAHQAWSANLFTTVSDIFPKKAIASVVGIGGLAGSIGGIYFPHFTGRLLDHFEKLNRPTEGYSILFGICACAYLAAFGLNHLLAPHFTPIQLEGD